jgi:hypothetical protein
MALVRFMGLLSFGGIEGEGSERARPRRGAGAGVPGTEVAEGDAGYQLVAQI